MLSWKMLMTYGGSPTAKWRFDLTKKMWLNYGIPSGYVKIAIENGPVEIVDFPIKHGNFPLLC